MVRFHESVGSTFQGREAGSLIARAMVCVQRFLRRDSQINIRLTAWSGLTSTANPLAVLASGAVS